LEKNLAKEKDEDDKEELRNSLKKLKTEMAVIRKTYGDTTTRVFTQTDRGLLFLQAMNDSLQRAGLPAAVRDQINKDLRRDQDNQGNSNFFDFNNAQYKSVADYGSAERKLPDSLRDDWFTRILKRRLIATSIEYRQDKKSWKEHFVENFLHSFPKILFFSLPFFALILNMLYFRHKQYYYVDHGIFTIHLYIANFILILFIVLLNKLSETINVGWISVIIGILIFLLCLYMLIYLYKAMRGFYNQRRAKTFVKYFITCGLAFIVNLILLMIFLVVSAITIH